MPATKIAPFPDMGRSNDLFLRQTACRAVSFLFMQMTAIDKINYCLLRWQSQTDLECT